MPANTYPEDEYFKSAQEEQMAEFFAEAIARLEDGDSIESILAGMSAGARPQMRAMLQINEFMTVLQHEPMPVRSVQRQRVRRSEFLNQVALERTRQELDAPVAQRTPALYTAQPIAQRGSAQRMQQQARTGWWQRLVDAFGAGNMRLAPVMLTLAIALTSMLGLWRVSAASLPGDLTYPIKAWVQMMNLSLTGPDRLPEVAQEASATVQADMAESARRAEEASASRVRQETVFLVFEGYDGRLLKFGDIRVLPTWQRDPASREATPMEVVGDLQPGSQVWLTVQILPGAADIVQGMRAEVQTATAPAAPEPTAIACTPRKPAGWGNYTVQRGDTLSALAQISNAPMRAIAGANCLESNVILAGQLLFLPNRAQVQQPAAPLYAPAVTSDPVVEPAALPQPDSPIGSP